MNFYRRNDLTHECQEVLARYDRVVTDAIGSDFPYPIRMRDWELYRILGSIEGMRSGAEILDAGAFNTYLSVYFARQGFRATASDVLRRRLLKSLLRAAGLAPRKPTEAPYFRWTRAVRSAGVALRNLDLTQLACPDASYDGVVALSVIEHVPAVERAMAEMYRVLRPGGKLLVTTDCAPEPKPYAGGIRYFTPSELERLIAPYPVTSPRSDPDFSRENWCYGLGHPVVTAFIEIVKPGTGGAGA